MNKIKQKSVRRRVNITLPASTLGLLDRLTVKRERSAFVDNAVRFYVQKTGQEKLSKQLRQGATDRAGRDLALAEEWFPIEGI